MGSLAYDKPTIFPHEPFNPKSDAAVLHEAMKGLGTNEKALINILTHRTVAQRNAISVAYRDLHKKQLLDAVKSETSGDFYRVLHALLQPPAVNDAQDLKHAMKGLGTDEDTLIEILFTRYNAELHEISNVYFAMYKKTLAAAITDDTSGDFKDLLLAIATGVRDESGMEARSMERVKSDAKALYDSGPKRLGTNMKTYIDIFATRSFWHLREVFEEFKIVAKMDIEDAIKSEMSGDTVKAFLTLVAIIKSKETYFAEQILKATKGLGTKDRKLIRIIVSRSEKDLAGIKEAYQRVYGKSLENVIESETSSDYKQTLLEIVRGRQ